MESAGAFVYALVKRLLCGKIFFLKIIIAVIAVVFVQLGSAAGRDGLPAFFTDTVFKVVSVGFQRALFKVAAARTSLLLDMLSAGFKDRKSVV